GCSQDPKEIHLGSDECAHCKMMITDPRFAAQIVTETGKAISFDAIECMSGYYTAHADDLQEAKRWVRNFNNPEQWMQVEEAVFVKSREISSPMGESLLALDTEVEAKQHLRQYPGEIVSWSQIIHNHSR
ncbi:MAG: nitrous oxide reductase accessory protein NosL, partial [Balneolaceae bacterium]|nr:nitrous oxide reductase accessory protein NosL [Balneolaceae bacterium]